MEPWGLDVGDVMYNYYNNRTWLSENPYIYEEVVKKGMEDFNMFYMAHFLHNSSILTLANPAVDVVNEVAAGAELGKVDMSKLVLPNTGYNGLLIVVLDPEMKLPDDNRTDNVFIEFVTVNTSREADTYCSVSPIAMGKLLNITELEYLKNSSNI